MFLPPPHCFLSISFFVSIPVLCVHVPMYKTPAPQPLSPIGALYVSIIIFTLFVIYIINVKSKRTLLKEKHLPCCGGRKFKNKI